MKHLSFLLVILLFHNSFSQTASSYFPENPGHIWRYKMTPLDTLNNPIDSLVIFRVDSFATTTNFNNRSAKLVLTKNGDDPFLYEEPFSDTIYYSFDQNMGYEYLGMSQLEGLASILAAFIGDTTLGVYNFFKSFEGWQSYYRFANTVNQQYIILSRDTTFTIDTLVLPLRFQILGRRFNDETINTDIGSFTCKKFNLERRLSYLLTFPPPIPPLAVKILGVIDTLWIAPNNWIVKSFIPSTLVDLSLLGLGSFAIPGLKMDIHNPPVSVEHSNFITSDYKLYQNYPNPFSAKGGSASGGNPTTKIGYKLKERGYVKLMVYDIKGERIAILVNQEQEAGYYEVEFGVGNGLQSVPHTGIASGIYLYRIEVIGEGNIPVYTEMKKMLLVK